MGRKRTTEPFGKPIEAKISIQPYIESVITRGELRTYMRLDVSTNGRHASEIYGVSYFCIADGEHYGEQSGPEWEAMKAHWQKQIDYLQKHLWRASGRNALFVSGEAIISQIKEWDLNALLSDADLKEVVDWSDNHSKEYSEKGIAPLWPGGGRGRLTPHRLTRFHALGIWNRLKNEPPNDVEFERGIGHFDEEQYNSVARRYPEYSNLWKKARRIYNDRDGRDDWQKDVREACGRHMPEDLLDDMKRRKPVREGEYATVWEYQPSDLGLIDACRQARILAKQGGVLEMSNLSSARNSLNAFADAKGKPRIWFKNK